MLSSLFDSVYRAEQSRVEWAVSMKPQLIQKLEEALALATIAWEACPPRAKGKVMEAREVLKFHVIPSITDAIRHVQWLSK